MNRLAPRFAALREQSRKALIPFITAGDPKLASTVPLMHALVEAGADVIELGVPFSDPMADGPVIQRASERALEHGTSLHDVLAMVSEFRRQDNDTPVVLMGYLNPVENFGYEAFAKAAQSAGVDGLLTVDLPPEEAEEAAPLLRRHGIAPIFLLAPTSTDERMASIARHAEGFVYYVSLKGVTGSSNLDVQGVADKLAQIRRHTDLPIGVGFGIKDAATAAAVAQVSDAVIVGSSLVRLIEEQGEQAQAPVAALLAEMRRAMDA